MKCKKTKLLDNLNKWIFMDEYGFCNLSVQDIMVNDKNYNQVFVYVAKNKRYEKITLDFNNLREIIETIFTKKIAIRSATKSRNPYGYYGGYNNNTPFLESEADQIKVNSVTIHIQVNYYSDISHGQTLNAYEQIELDNLEDFDKYECWLTENFNNNSYQPIDCSSLKEGYEFYLVGEGKVKVTKMYDFPNNKELLCDVVDTDDNKHTIQFTREHKLLELPYLNKKTMLDEIDDAKNELLLSPFSSSNKEGTYNIYWKNVTEACRYMVSIYKIQGSDRKIIYHIADFDIERNTCYLILTNLIGGNFIFKVIAEDRSGKIIAKSRGFSDGYPRYYKE